MIIKWIVRVLALFWISIRTSAYFYLLFICDIFPMMVLKYTLLSQILEN